MRRTTAIVVVCVGFLCLFASPVARAQSAFTGVVRDTTGAVLPGVTADVSSPALIEKSRMVITDERGSYRVVDLRPGVYTLEFSLPGFNNVKREVELQSNFTATVNVEMTVGATSESVTVSTETPVVDVQNNQKIQILAR